MSTDGNAGVLAPERAGSLLLEMATTSFDEVIEIDLVRGRVRSLRHAQGKYFVPVPDGPFESTFRYSADYMIHPDDREEYLRFHDVGTLYERLEASEIPGVLRASFRYKLLDGGWLRAEETLVGGARHGMPEGVIYALVANQETEEEQAFRRGTSSERNDLTGLLWEEEFFEQAEEVLRRHPSGWCMIAIDLEHFKLFNEWYGRQQGDLLLAIIGAKLKKVEIETGGLACYLGQDDFALLAPRDREMIERLFDDIHELITDYGTSVGFMPAFGVSEADADGAPMDLYDRAALAARHAKENYHTRIRSFTPAMYEQTEREYHILSDFQKALKDRELFIQLQPQCQISNGRVVGAESLVRWRKADGEMVPPGVFVPVLEKYGFITDLDEYVWEEVCIWQKKWLSAGHTPLPVSVNVSQIDIFTIDVPAFFDQLIRKYDLPVDVLKIEITESAYVDSDHVADAVQRLRGRGFLVLMDDFGSGYSSLNMLRNLNVDIIKLDAQFLRMNGSDRKGIQIMDSIVNMAKTMGVPIIVEGVETKEELEFLSGLGCRYAQGYFFYRPMQVADYERLIADPQRIDTRGFRFKAREQFHIREFLDQNVFSDAMLNNILGPVAFFLRHGEDVDILRFNQQFYQETRAASFSKRPRAIQRTVIEEDAPALNELFDRAVEDPVNGATGVVRFSRLDGAVAQFRMHVFFLEEDEKGKRFYCSVQDLTQFVTLNDHMRLIARLSPDNVIFLRGRGTELTFQVAVHGLEGALGLTREELERELNEGSFRERLDPSERERLLQLIVDAGMCMEEFSPAFRVTGADGRQLRLRVKFDSVRDEASGVEYLMLLRRADD